MIKKTFICIILFQVVLSMSFISGQQAYQNGWKSFSQNNRMEARKYFTEAISDSATSSDALLSLSLLDWNENKLDAAFESFQKFYNSSTNPDAYVYAMYSLPYVYEQNNIMSKTKLAFFEKMVENPNIQGTLKAMLNESLGEHYRNVNNQKKSTENFDKMRALKNWQVLGSFDNTSGSGFAKNWGAVEYPLATHAFINKYQANVNWYSPTYNKENNWFVFDYYFNLNNAIFYAQTFVNSDSEQDVILRAGTSGSIKIWVNDALIGSVSDERNCDMDIYAYKTKLNKGSNRILVQIGVSEIDRGNFLVRLTDANSKPIENITSSSVYSDYIKSTEKPSCEQLVFFAEKFFQDKISREKQNPLNYILLAETYLRNDKAYEATKLLKDLEALYGKSTLSSYLLYEAYIRAQNQTDYEKEMETIKNTDSNSFFSLEDKYNDAIKSEKYTDAQEICKNVKDLYGESATTEGWELGLASYQKRFDDLIALSKKLYKKYPENYTYANLNAVIEKEVNKSPSSQIAVLEKYCRNYYNSGAIDDLAKAYFENGNAQMGIDLLTKQLQRFPYSTDLYDNIINALYSMQQYNQALVMTDKALTLEPFKPDMYINRGYIYKNLNKIDLAKENFSKSIYYEPTSYDSRTQLRLLDNKKEIFDLLPKTDLKELIKKSPTAKEYPEDNSMIVLNDVQQVVYPEGAKEIHREIAIKILNQAGIDRWKQYNIGYNGYNQKLIIDKSEVVKTNGIVAKAETSENRIVFTNLEVNDVIHIEYRIRDYSYGKLANNFFDQFLFKRSMPTMVIKYNLMVPTDAKFTYQITNGTLEPEISTVENMKLYKWELDNQPAVKEEKYMSAYIDVLPTLHYSSLPDWKYVSDWYKDLTTSKFNTDFVLKETLSELLKGKENLSQLEKAKIFYNYILENITYSSVDFLQSNYIPQKASRTITTRLGDCKDLSTLFVTLCRESGINANLVLINTRDNGYNTMPLPSIGFNHCIAQLNIDKKVYYLELTDNTLPFGSALKQDLNSEILPIANDDQKIGDKLMKLDMVGRTTNGSIRTHKISFTKNDMNINRQYIYYGAMASYERNEFKNTGSDERLKKKSEAVAKSFETPTKVTDLQFSKLDDLTDSVTDGYKVEVKNAVQDVAGMKIFSLPWSDTNSLSIVSSETREYPFEFWSYQSEDKTIEKIIIELPQGKTLAEVPQNLQFDCTAASYILTYDTRTPGKVFVTRSFIRKSDQISIKDYPAFREFMNKISEADNKKYAFK